MLKFNPVTYYFKRPIGGMVREDDRTMTWTLTEVTFNFLRGDQAQPSDGLVFNCQKSLRDAEGNEIPVEILALLDLEQGLRDLMKEALEAAWAAVETPR